MQMNLNAISNNTEKYMAFMLGYNLVFIDSFQFTSSSLIKLVSNLPKEDLKYTSAIFKDKALDLMSKKGVYPYDYMDSFDKFNQTTFPAKEQFYSQLNDEQYKKKFGRVLPIHILRTIRLFEIPIAILKFEYLYVIINEMSKFLTFFTYFGNHFESWGNEVRQLLIKGPSGLHVSRVRLVPSCNSRFYC